MCLLLAFFIFQVCATVVTGATQFCQDSSDCSMRIGTTCKNSECVCSQSPDNPRACSLALSIDELCTTDIECDNILICEKLTGTCRCPRGSMWEKHTKKCILYEEEIYVGRRYDLTKDVIIPSIILATLAITASLCYKFICSHKSWRRRRRGADMARALEEAQLPHVSTSQPATWIASYRGSIPPIGPFISVFGTVERSGPPCLLLPVGPPPYEEALKHKVILSSLTPATPPLAALAETTSL